MTEEDETGHPDERAEGSFCGLCGLLRYRRRPFAHSVSGRTKLAFECEGAPLVLGGFVPVSVAGGLGAGARKEVGVECRDRSDALWTGGRGLEHGGSLFRSAPGYLPQEPHLTAPALVRSRKNQIPGGADIVHPGAAVLPDCVRRCPDRD